MMGSRLQTTAMFHYFCLDDWVPADHLLRAIDRHVDFGSLRHRLRPLYSDIGRPSVDPEVLLRILLIGYLYGITSERRLIDEVGLNLAYRWFTGLGFDQAIPDHSTFSKNRHGRFREFSLFHDFFEDIVKRCVTRDWYGEYAFRSTARRSQQMLVQRVTFLWLRSAKLLKSADLHVSS